jgi:valyl-tRNA synthetase
MFEGADFRQQEEFLQQLWEDPIFVLERGLDELRDKAKELRSPRKYAILTELNKVQNQINGIKRENGL